MTAARKSTKKKKKTRAARFSPPPVVTAAGRHGGWLLLAAAGVALAVGAGPLERRVGSLRSDPLTAEIAWPALEPEGLTWMPEGERRRLTDLLLSTVSIDPTDRGSLDRARTALSSTGWFSEGPTLRRRPGGTIEVTGAWRRPAAVVRTGAGDVVVSAGARRLPLIYPAGGAGPLRWIRGAWGSDPGPGEVWGGGDVASAVALLDELRSSPAWPWVAGIDVSRALRSGILSVITTEGAEIVWGSAPGTSAPGQVTHAVRLARFEALRTDPAWAAAGRPRVEIYLPSPIINESAPGD